MKAFVVSILFCWGITSVFAEEPSWSFEAFKQQVGKASEGFIEEAVGAGGANSLFYFPIRISDTLPSKYGYKYEDIQIKSEDGTKLHAWIVKSTAKAVKGVVVYAHGNTGSINSHFGFCSWLVNEGYHIVLVDYRGYGKSEGYPERKGMVEDVMAGLKFGLEKKEWLHLPLFCFGHSLGVAKSIPALEKFGAHKRLKGAVLWAGFSSYIKIAEDKIGKMAQKVVSDEFAPKSHVGKIKTPLLFLHGQKDFVVPMSHSKELYDIARSDKKLIIAATGGHNNTLWVEKKKMQIAIVEWMAEKSKSSE